MSRPYCSMSGRKVKWTTLTQSHDARTLIGTTVQGVVIESAWDSGMLHLCIVDRDGLIHIRKADSVSLVDSAPILAGNGTNKKQDQVQVQKPT